MLGREEEGLIPIAELRQRQIGESAYLVGAEVKDRGIGSFHYGRIMSCGALVRLAFVFPMAEVPGLCARPRHGRLHYRSAFHSDTEGPMTRRAGTAPPTPLYSSSDRSHLGYMRSATRSRRCVHPGSWRTP